MKKKVFTSLGLMTGTSVDGVDLSLIKSDGFYYFTSILNKYYEFERDLRNGIIELREEISSVEDLKKYSEKINFIEREFTLFHAEIINEVLKEYKEIEIIGFHGQTIFHNPNKKISLQLGDGKLLSQLTQKMVVNNFRKNDLDNGGQGAPLTPIFHKLISINICKEFKIHLPLNIINIGGITNITLVSDNEILKNDNLKAYDIGPGNCLIDEWIRKNSKKTFDENGIIGKSGKVNDLIFNQAVDNFSNYSLLKSLDVKDFDVSFAKGLSLEDGCATVTKFSAYLIAEGLNKMGILKDNSKNIYLICGGGRKNDFLIKNIKDFISNKKIEFKNIDNFELDGDYIESQAFAYLAVRSYLDLPISFPNTTRCKFPISGGIINKNF